MKMRCNPLGTFLEVFQFHRHTLFQVLFFTLYFEEKKSCCLISEFNADFSSIIHFHIAPFKHQAKTKGLREYAGICVSSPDRMSDS